jgi:hypothetical protein
MAGDKPRKTTTRERLIDLALRKAGAAAKGALDRQLAGVGFSTSEARQTARRKSMVRSIAAAAVARLATRSVPGAIAASGILAAGALIGRRNPAGDAPEAPAAVEDSAE